MHQDSAELIILTAFLPRLPASGHGSAPRWACPQMAERRGQAESTDVRLETDATQQSRYIAVVIYAYRLNGQGYSGRLCRISCFTDAHTSWWRITRTTIFSRFAITRQRSRIPCFLRTSKQERDRYDPATEPGATSMNPDSALANAAHPAEPSSGVAPTHQSPPVYRLYDSTSVALATLLGSPVAGTRLMALNYRRLGKSGAAANRPTKLGRRSPAPSVVPFCNYKPSETPACLRRLR
jgi:hypothetical protein